MAKRVKGHRANKPNDSFGTVNSGTLYKGKYREEVYTDDEDDEEEGETVEAQDADPKESATSQEANDSFAADTKASEPDYKKRYDDLKRHYDEKLSEWRSEKEELLSKMLSSQHIEPEDVQDLDRFKAQHPDVYNAIHKISASQSEARVRNLEGELEEIKQREKALEKQKAYEELLRLQPDFESIKSSDKFISWLESQPTSISDGVYNNATDAKWASRVVDLYKADTGLSKTPKNKVSKNSDAAMSVTRGSAKEVGTNRGETKIWKASEIGKLKPWEFEKLESEIDAARSEGRIDFNS